MPWMRGPAAAKQPNGQVVVLNATKLSLHRYRDIPAFTWSAMRLWLAFRNAPGGIGLGLTAWPLRKTFTTFSAWESEEAMRAYVRSPAHARVMRRFHPRLGPTASATWTVERLQRRRDWAEAHQRLEASAVNP